MTEPTSSRQSRRNSLLFRAGLGVWLLCGLVLLTSAVRAQFQEAPQEENPRGSVRPSDSVTADSSSFVRRYQSDYQLRTGDEIVLVFLGGSFCGAHRRPGFPEAVEEAKLQVRQKARASGKQFRAVAVSLDWEPSEALAFLEGFGAFDEMLLGGNWVSNGAQRYVWRDMPGEPLVPQFIVLERRVDVAQTAIKVSGEHVLKRVLGADAIEEWVRSGAPF